MHLNEADVHENQCSYFGTCGQPDKHDGYSKKYNKKSNKESKNYKKEVP
jgi:hypothetical protein